MRVLGRELGVPLGVWAPKPVMKIGALLMQTEAELALKSRRVVSRRLLENGFRFEFPNCPRAARDLAH